jgi:predicted nucleic-acid-binding protein
VIALDTNVLARAIVAEANADSATKAQQQRAKALLASGRNLFVPVTVIEELEWVLRGVYGMPPAQVASIFDDLLAVENITMDRAAAVGQALAWYRRGLDFSDALHLAQAALCECLATFDARFSRAARRLGLTPPVAAPSA